MLNEAMILGIVLAIVISAVAIYLYSYVSYLEKKVGMIETMVVDLRIAMDSILTDDPTGRVAAPISPSPAPAPPAAVGNAVPAPAATSGPEEADEGFYNSVLNQAHDETAPAEPEEGLSMEEALKGLSEEATPPMEGMAGLPAAEATQSGGAASIPVAAPAPAVTANYDSMTRAELAAEAERRGLRVKRSMNRNEVLSLLRRAAPTQLQSEPAGAENASGLFPDAEQLDSSGAVDLGEV